MTTKKTTPKDFEKSLRELEALVARLEGGDLSLEETLKQFERGISLTRQKALAEAEQKVEILVEKSGRLETEPFEPDQ
jgi:exodeoxyribonuclease VII small subunit